MQPHEIAEAGRLVRIALQEDLNGSVDITTHLLIAPQDQGRVAIRSRQTGIFCGAHIIPLVFAEIDPEVTCVVHSADGDRLEPGTVVAELSGSVRSLLTGERTVLNFLTLLCGVSSLTRRYVDAAARPQTQILDTRKTLPGLRSLQKFAVRCGGGTNHRIGLYDAVLVKDNHLADWHANSGRSLADAVRHVRSQVPAGMIVEFEVDTLNQLREILPERPDIILLDNMAPPELSAAIELRNQLAPGVLLEASGGVNLSTIGGIAATGVDRISVGALTHSAPALDLGFDWMT